MSGPREIPNKMTPEEALAALKNVSEDTEWGHVEADAILCALLRFYGQDEIVREYDEIGKWYA